MFLFSDVEDLGPFHAHVQFVVYLVDGVSGAHTREARSLRSWFKTSLPENQRHRMAQDFFRDLVSPEDFPRGIESTNKSNETYLSYTCLFIFRLCWVY